jgi:hypothetical protein
LDAQLGYHLDALEAEGRAQGLSPDDARAAARRAMGGLAQVKDAYRDQLRILVVDAIPAGCSIWMPCARPQSWVFSRGHGDPRDRYCLRNHDLQLR